MDQYRYLKRGRASSYDAPGRTFESRCCFPVVMNNESRTVNVHQIIYSSRPVSSTSYRLISGVNIDDDLFHDVDSALSIEAACDATNPTPGSYISCTFGKGLGGASFGLAAALAIMGVPPVIATGFLVPGNAVQTVDDTDLYQIDNLSHKLRSINAKYRLPLLFPASGILEGRQGSRMRKEYIDGLYMTPIAITKGVEYSERYIGLVAKTLLQAAALASASYDSEKEVELEWLS